MNMNMNDTIITTYLHDEMIYNYKLLILYTLRRLEIIELRKLIWEKIFDDEDLELMNQEWYEIELHELHPELGININDLELDSD